MSKTNQKQREEFRTRLGFIVACIGSAVGMGNIWMFPYRLGQYGGAAFLIPYLLFRAAGIGLSNLLSLEEGIFLTWFIWIGVLWSVMLLFQGIRIVHQYSAGKAIVAIVLSLLGIAIVLFFLLLIFALFQQIFTFFRSVIGELMFRR